MEPALFALRAIDALGGVAEPDPAGGTQVLLPNALATELSLANEARLLNTPEVDEAESGCYSLTHGSQVLERLIEATLGAGRTVHLSVDAPSPRRLSDAAVAALLEPTNGAVRVQGSELCTQTYIVLGFRYTATGEERREGLVDVAVDPTGTRVALDLPRALWDGAPKMSETRAAQDVAVAAQVARASAALARAGVADALDPVRRILGNRLGRDVSRMHGYFRAMQEELLRTAGRGKLENPERDKLLARINAIPGELDRRIGEARMRLSLKVGVRPVLAAVVTMPAIQARLVLLRRKGKREIPLTYGALQRGWDLPLCDGCLSRGVAKPVLCDDAVHMLCSRCHYSCPKCDATTCLACHKRCQRCGRAASAQPQDLIIPRRAAPAVAKPEASAPSPLPAKEPAAAARRVPKPPRPAPGDGAKAVSEVERQLQQALRSDGEVKTPG